MDSTCDICVEFFNRSTNTRVECYCGFVCCKKCLKKYILDTNDDAQCMSPKCKRIFDRKFLINNVEKKFVNNEYKFHREEILFRRETAALEAMQKEIEYGKVKEQFDIESRIISFDIRNIRSYIAELRVINYRANARYNCPIITAGKTCNVKLSNSLKCNKCEKQYIVPNFCALNNTLLGNIYKIDTVKSLQDLYDLINIKFDNKFILSKNDEPIFDKSVSIMYKKIISEYLITQFDNKLVLIYETKNKLEKIRKTLLLSSVYIRLCPSNTCNGFLNDQHTCDLCGINTCSECREIKDVNHQCDPDIIKTIKLLDNDSKPCPGCKSLIYKSVGCLHMWCTKCEVYFDWKTLKIIKSKHINNPEYFDAMERRHGSRSFVPRDPNDVLCGREVDRFFIEELCDLVPNYHKSSIKHICFNVDSITYLYSNHTSNANFINQIRRDYLFNLIDVTTFKTKLQQYEKKEKKNEAIMDILVMAHNTITELLYRLYDSLSLALELKEEKEEIIIDEFLNEVKSLTIITNDAFVDIWKVYTSRSYKVYNRFDIS